eukprot:TRINITY_DN1358_c0_g1_i1.p2 TRINITY_DN1358_c0_g1~~TRINITY_DN1358_c0_g1_i1.p2  ORF type:complete len:353 (+),score=165.16 TRINITY_DN1358_c0_g1_i1:71-1129(+)
MMRCLATVVLAAGFSSSAALRISNKTATAVAAPTEKDVEMERSKLEKMDVALHGMLQGDTLSHSKVAPALKLFADNLNGVLNQTKSMKPADAMKKLLDAKAGVSNLVSEMTHQQESLMKEDFKQRENLLMGVLMTNKKESMDKQLEILKDDDFEGLDVSKALLKSHDNSTALYMQAAKWLDAHKDAGGVMSKKSHTSKAADLAASFDKRVAALEKESEARELHHKKHVEDLEAIIKKGGKEAKIAKIGLKREEHRFKKTAAQSKRDIASMKEAAAAMRSGDMKALKHAQDALQKSLDSLKSGNAGMLVFLQEGNSIMETDCPYCAAQCVEKCHNNGKAYTECLTECADAGKN